MCRSGNQINVFLGGFLLMMCCALPASAAMITELVSEPFTLDATAYPRYIELDVRDFSGTGELVILDAGGSRAGQVRAVYPIPAGDADMVIMHESTWAAPPVVNVDYQSVTDLNLSHPILPLARWVVLFDHVTGWHEMYNAGDPNTWTGIHDSLTLSISGRDATAMPDTAIIDLDPLTAPALKRTTESTTVGQSSALNLDPGRLFSADPPAYHPEPGSMVILLALASTTALRRKKHN